MPDVATPKPVSDVISSDLFDGGHLPEELRLKCRYHFVHEQVQTRQDRDEPVPQKLMDALNRLEETMIEQGIRPSDVLTATME